MYKSTSLVNDRPWWVRALVFLVFTAFAVGSAQTQLEPCEITPSEFWKNTFEFPDDDFRVIGLTPNNPDWVKFTIPLCDPGNVYYQDSNAYPFHYNFATAHLDPYLGISEAEFQQISLHAEGQELILGAVLTPASGAGGGPSARREFGIQFVGLDPYPPERIVELFHQVKDTVIADPAAQAFYFPTYEQLETAQESLEYLTSNGVMVSSTARWADGNVCYSEGWALGRLKFFEGRYVESAYRDGDLGPGDILLTDGVPAELPFLAGIISLSPSTPNSHVAILARTYQVPFVHLALDADVDRAWDLLGHRIALRAYELRFQSQGLCDARLIDVENQLSDETIAEILQLKEPPALDIRPMRPYGAYSASTDGLVPADIQYFGGKASNYGFLRRTIPDHTPVACAFSFDLWNAFLDQTLPGGGTLRDFIAARLSAHTYPPNMDDLADDLDDIRDLIKDDDETLFSTPLQDAIIATLQDPAYGFDPTRNIRFRSSTNVEDSDHFTGAGLYESFSGCLADDLDGNPFGPSHCDPTETAERGVFRAIRRAFASFYYDNAFLERLRYGLDESEVGMGLLVHHSYPDDMELANGVAVFELGASRPNVRLVSQVGATSIANPEDGSIPEEVLVEIFTFGMSLYVSRHSSLTLLGDTVLTYEQDYRDLAQMMYEVAQVYAASTGQSRLLLDFEYKKVAPDGALVIKQVRKIPQPDTTPSITPFLVNDPTPYCTFQGEWGDVLANHRLKMRGPLSTDNLWMTPAALEESFFAETPLMYTDGCWVSEQKGSLADWPQAAHDFDAGAGETTDTWAFPHLDNPRQYKLRSVTIPGLVSQAESPLLTIIDLSPVDLTVNYAQSVIGLDWFGFTTTTTDIARLEPCHRPHPEDKLQQRVLVDADQGITIATSFYWPAEGETVGGYTAPLIRWEETVIEGLTTEPIVLRDWFSQTYRPGHHNFTEFYLFEPRLEPGLSPSTLRELDQLGVQYIYAEGSTASITPTRVILLAEDMTCAQAACEADDDCGFPDTGRYCDKAPGDCAGVGACAAIPAECPPLEEPVCACAGDTHGNACEAAKLGQSVAYAGTCVSGDIDVDADVDLDDYALWSACLAGPGETMPPGDCPTERMGLADLDDDGDIDLTDFAALQAAFMAE